VRVTVAADWGGSMGGCGCAGGRALLWGSCWRRAMSALALLRCAWAASSLHHSATRRPPFPCCRFSRLSVANSVGGAAVPRVCEGGSAGLRRQACTLPGYGDEGTRSPTLRGAQLTPTAPTAAGPSRHDPRLAWPGVSHKDPKILSVSLPNVDAKLRNPADPAGKVLDSARDRTPAWSPWDGMHVELPRSSSRS
jgi:hypothetical protein